MKTKDYLLYVIVLLLCGLGMFFLTKIANRVVRTRLECF